MVPLRRLLPQLREACELPQPLQRVVVQPELDILQLDYEQLHTELQ